MVIDSFRGDYWFLSNFSFSPLVVRVEYFTGLFTKLAYSTVEHGYQARRVAKFADAERVRLTADPGEAKKLARSLPQTRDWHDKIRIPWMTKLIDLKFPLYKDLYQYQNYVPELTQRLLATGNASLIEGNAWGDDFWGKYKGNGENHLGRILMNRRDTVEQLIQRYSKAA